MEMMSTENSVINGREADLLLYGEIVNNAGAGEDVVLGKAVVSEILALSQSCDKIRVHINSEGGEVYAGIAIFNALRSCAREVTIYTDGISASIAGIIAMCGRKHYMSKYARLMIHSVSAGVYGDKNDLLATVDEIKALEDTLAVIIGERMKCSPEEVKTRYFDGTDHWFTAEEAVKLGLADGIYDIAVPDLQGADGPSDIYRKVFTNRAVIRSQIVNNMEITRIKEKPRFTNVVNEDDVLRVIDELNAQIEKLEGENSNLKQRLSEMEQEDIEKILSAAVECGKIEEGEKEDYRQLLNSNRASAEKVITSLKPKRKVKDDITGGQPVNSASGAWDTKMEEIRRNRSRR